jgi:kynurenine formamidase
MHYVDLSQTLTNNMPVYPGDAPPKLKQLFSLEKDGVANFELTGSMHIGTHVDGPAHMIVGGRNLTEFPAEKFFGRGVVVDARGKMLIDESVLKNISLERGDAVLVCTGWAENFGDKKYYKEYPSVTEGFAAALVDAGVSMIGMDGPSPDHPPFNVHKRLLNDEILIIENLTNVTELIGKKFELSVLPLKIAADSAPARVMAKVS